MRTLVAGALVGQLFAFSLNAIADQEPTQSRAQKADEKILERITVAGTKEQEAAVAGSAHVLDEKELDAARGGFDDVGRVLGQLPGVNVQDEEGYGRRPNIGFRGVPVERSESITLMEDSVLIAPAPYSAPAAYYFPPIGRMESVEVLKGASQIKYGPRTLGGSLNMFSTSIPNKFSVDGLLGAGSDDALKGKLAVGNSYRYGGWLLEGYHLQTDGFKKLDGGGDTGFDLRDLLGKFRLNTDPEAEMYQQLEFKINDYNEDSNETYLGLSEDDFDADPFRRYRASELDKLDVQHQQYQVRHFIELNDSWDVTTTLYRNNTQRAWYKLDSVGGSSISDILDDTASFADQYGWITGLASPEESLVIRDNNRRYYASGIQTVVGGRFETGSVGHKLEVGARFHTDEENRFQRDDYYQMINGQMVLNRLGLPGSQSNRIDEADAWSFHVQDEVSVGDFKFIPGLRYETIEYTRKDYGKNDPSRTGAELKRTETDNDALIPGLGVHWKASDEVGTFVGIYKGFAPSGPGGDGVKEEKSINYEAGVNFARSTFKTEAVLFWNDYDNLLGADTLAAGGTGSGDLFNAGQATARGVEFSMNFDPGLEYDLGVSLPVRAAYTYTDAEFDSSFVSGLFGTVAKGDSLPYIPEHQAFVGLGVRDENIGGLEFKMRYVDSMPTFAGAEDSGPGASTDEYVVFDATAEVPLTKNATFFVDALNIFDNEYIVARRPAGARPGLPFTVLAGVKFNLG